MFNMKISIILGTRPEIIKMSSVIRECEKRNLDYFIIHSNQHYSENMDKIFFDDLGIEKPKYNLGIGSGNHGNQTGKILIQIEEILIKENPDIVLVQGDTNTTLGGALAATKLNIKVGHVEAGLRSYNRRMPEETNRIVADHVSDYLFCPTEKQKEILLNEGVEENKIFVVGNTVTDAVKQNIKIAEKNSDIMEKMGLKKDGYFLVTAHRALNVDFKENLEKLFDTLKAVKNRFEYTLIYPIHPRTKKMVDSFSIDTDGIKLIDPVGYFDFLLLEKNARLIFSDSGGVQEESCILNVPCITLRKETERPETVEAGANLIAGIEKDKVLECAEKMINRKRDWKNPYGNGDTGEQIINVIKNDIE